MSFESHLRRALHPIALPPRAIDMQGVIRWPSMYLWPVGASEGHAVRWLTRCLYCGEFSIHSLALAGACGHCGNTRRKLSIQRSRSRMFDGYLEACGYTHELSICDDSGLATSPDVLGLMCPRCAEMALSNRTENADTTATEQLP